MILAIGEQHYVSASCLLLLGLKSYTVVDTPLQRSRHKGPGFKIPPIAEILTSFVCIFKVKFKENELMANPRTVKVIIKIYRDTFWQQISIFYIRALGKERFAPHSFLLEERKVLQSNQIVIKESKQAVLLRFMKMMSQFMNSTD